MRLESPLQKNDYNPSVHKCIWLLPAAKFESFSLATKELLKRTAGEKGVVSRELANGTSVILIYAKDVLAMLELVKAFTIAGDR
jgi:hypothetical protein